MFPWTQLPDVWFDHRAAGAAVVEAERAVGLLDAWLAVQESDVQQVLEGWSGRSREAAKEALSVHAERVLAIRDQLRWLVDGLEEAQAAARHEQDRRVAQRLESDT